MPVEVGGEKRSEHRPRDTVWREDDQQAYTGNGPRTMASLRNLSLGLFAINGITKIKRSNRPCKPSAATPYEPCR